MPEQPLSQQEIKDQLSDITEIAEGMRIELPEGVKTKLHEEMEIILEKLNKGEEITTKDLVFIKKVRDWLKFCINYKSEIPYEVYNNSDFKELIEVILFSGNQDLGLIMGNTRFEDNKIIIENRLDLSNTKIKNLPANLYVDYLNLQNTTIEHLPDNLHVNRSLSIHNTKIKRLPKNISILNGLVLSKDAPESLKKDVERLQKEGKILGKVLIT